MIRIEHLSKSYGQIQALQDVNLNMSKGEVISILGPNGAGKSTLMRLICGYLSPTAGSVFIAGANVHTDTQVALSNIGYVAENCPLYQDMNVYEYIRYVADLRQLKKAVFEYNLKNILYNLQLSDVITQRIDTLSKGYRHRVGIAGALIHGPQILILDEPTEGLDPNQKHQIHKFIREYGRDKLVIVSTHIMEEVEAMSDRVVLINKGQIIIDNTPQYLKQLVPDNNIASAFRLLTGED